MEVSLKHKDEFISALEHYAPSQEAIDTLATMPLVILLSVTGGGRNTIINRLVETGRYHFIVSDTTRPAKVRNGELEVDGEAYHFRDEEDVIHITGKKVEEFIAMTNFNQPEAIARLRGIFKKIGLEKALLKYGVQDGDSLVVGGREFEWNGDFDNEAPTTPEHAGYKRRTTKQERLDKRNARRKAKREAKNN